jgi:hypothetical protein
MPKDIPKRDQTQRSNSSLSRKVTAIAIGIQVLIFLGCMSFSIGERHIEAPADGSALVQNGEVRVPSGMEQDVYYPIPFACPPNLVIDDCVHEYAIIDQRADHFRIRNLRKAGVMGDALEVEWTARGLRARTIAVPVAVSVPLPAPEKRSEPDVENALPVTPIPVDSSH